MPKNTHNLFLTLSSTAIFYNISHITANDFQTSSELKYKIMKQNYLYERPNKIAQLLNYDFS